MEKNKKKILAIIPARSGSKRVPNKNIRNFLGKPLIAYTIKQALSCEFIDRVIVDTDSPEIAKVAKKYGADVLWLRPKKLAGDKSVVIDAFFYDLKRLKDEQNYEPDYIMILQTTSPLREKKDIEDCWEMMKKTDAGTILTVCPTHPKFYYLNRGGKLFLVNGSEKKSNNTQGWRPGYLLNGCFVYIIKTSVMLKEKLIITSDTRAVICPKWRSVDIDNPEDWVLAETLYPLRNTIAKKIQKLNAKK